MPEETAAVKMLDWSRREIVHTAMQPPRWEGYQTGLYEIEMGEGAVIQVDVGGDENAVLQQINRFMERVIEENADAMVDIAGGTDEDELMEVAWEAINPIRVEGYERGDYQVIYNDESTIDYTATQRDAAALLRYDQLLLRVYAANRDAVERVIERDEECLYDALEDDDGEGC